MVSIEKLVSLDVDFQRVIGVTTMVPVKHIFVPRRAIGRIRKIQCSYAVIGSIGGTDQEFRLWVVIVPSIILTSTAFVVAQLEGWRPMAGDIASASIVGTPANFMATHAKVKIEQDFDRHARGVEINNRSGTRSLEPAGWTILLINTSSANSISVDGLSSIDFDLEFPSSKSMVFAREHVANEENQ